MKKISRNLLLLALIGYSAINADDRIQALGTATNELYDIISGKAMYLKPAEKNKILKQLNKTREYCKSAQKHINLLGVTALNVNAQQAIDLIKSHGDNYGARTVELQSALWAAQKLETELKQNSENPISVSPYEELAGEALSISNEIIEFCEKVMASGLEDSSTLKKYVNEVKDANQSITSEKSLDTIFSQLKGSLLRVTNPREGYGTKWNDVKHSINARNLVSNAAKTTGVDTTEVLNRFQEAIDLYNSLGSRVITILFERADQLLAYKLKDESLDNSKNEQLIMARQSIEEAKHKLKNLDPITDYVTVKREMQVLQTVGNESIFLKEVAEEAAKFPFSRCNLLINQ